MPVNQTGGTLRHGEVPPSPPGPLVASPVAFHHVKALLFSKGLESKTQEGTSHLFNLHFVKKGILPAACGRLLSRLQK
ncbi:MAG: hypothetical protein RDV48_27060 [Candidatus Eremiobacteraeota bacterium]|nr:hypothetical protein [Candidatus Eremiobacteraeota bacterium]